MVTCAVEMIRLALELPPDMDEPWESCVPDGVSVSIRVIHAVVVTVG